MKHRESLSILLLTLSAGVFADAPDEPWNCEKGRGSPVSGTSLRKPSEVIEIAVAAAKKGGWELAKYRQSSICFRSDRPGQWTVFFEGLERRPGNHFLVSVRDDTGTTKILPGE
jgi:hypothetical protein